MKTFEEEFRDAVAKSPEDYVREDREESARRLETEAEDLEAKAKAKGAAHSDKARWFREAAVIIRRRS